MNSVLHLVYDFFHWIGARLAAVGISAAVTAIGGLIMWYFGFRKAKLDNQKLTLEVQRLQLELQELATDLAGHAEARKTAEISDRIFELARATKQKASSAGSLVFYEWKLAKDFHEPEAVICRALMDLRDKGLAQYHASSNSWILQ